MPVLLSQERSIELTVLKMTFWRATTAFNIVIETTLALIPFWLVWGLQIKPSRKISVIIIFSLRAPYVPFPEANKGDLSSFRG